MLNFAIFQKAIKHQKLEPDLDCFALRLNTQLSKYISYKVDPYTYFTDAFSANWGFYNCYLFPLFSLIDLNLQKIHMHQIEADLAFPKWPTQPWYNIFQRMLSQEPYVVNPHKLLLPHKPEELQPLWLKLTLLIGLVSGKYS